MRLVHRLGPYVFGHTARWNHGGAGGQGGCSQQETDRLSHESQQAHGTPPLLAGSTQRSASLASSGQLVANCSELLAIGYSLPALGYLLLAIRYRLFAKEVTWITT